MPKSVYVYILHICVIFPNIAICGKYDFAVFENFEETRKIFSSEMKIVLFLGTINTDLAYRMGYLDQMIKAEKTSYIFSSSHLFRLFIIGSRYYDVGLYIQSRLGREIIKRHKMRHSRNAIMALDIKYPLPADELLSGALRGVMILHETYHLNLERFGRGELLDHATILKSRKSDSLKADDLAFMAVEAFKMDCYDSSIKYINSSTNSYDRPVFGQKQVYYGSTQFEKMTLRIRRYYAKHHNNLLLQSRTTAGPLSEGVQWKLFPNIVDEGSNMKILHFIINT